MSAEEQTLNVVSSPHTWLLYLTADAFLWIYTIIIIPIHV